MRKALLLLLAGVLAGCGSGDAGGGAASGASGDRSDRLVDFAQDPPYVNSLVVAEDESFLLTTNRGFFRISADGKDVERVRGSVSARGASSPVGTFLEVEPGPGGTLLGSGHPDETTMPQYLGFLRSGDGGRTWDVVSRLGEADLHRIHAVHDRLYAFDAVLGAVLTSENDGRTWKEHFTPRELVLDLVVDPEDPERLVISTDTQLYSSPDTGDGWRPVGDARAARLDWPASDTLMRADSDGRFFVSADAGRTWERRGRIDGEPYKVRAVDAERAFVALSDGTILVTEDGGRTFATRFAP
jgi:photosystem II stability/assembly factor-like uncharacterized protein